MDFEIVKKHTLEIGSLIYNDHEIFPLLLEELSKLNFITSSCNLGGWNDFLGFKQGGSNDVDIVSIRLLAETDRKITILVQWDEFDGEPPDETAICIFYKD